MRFLNSWKRIAGRLSVFALLGLLGFLIPPLMSHMICTANTTSSNCLEDKDGESSSRTTETVELGTSKEKP